MSITETISTKSPMPMKLSWADIFIGQEIGESYEYQADLANSIRNVISGKVMLIYPEREYETTTTLKPGKVIITRRK